MKKTIIAIALTTLFSSSASAVKIYNDGETEVDIYGRIQYDFGSFSHQKDNPAKNQNLGGEGEMRLGFNFSHRLNNKVDLIGKYESWLIAEDHGKAANQYKDVKNKDSITARQAWLGFRFDDTTELIFGKSYIATYQLTGLTDTIAIFGNAVQRSGGPSRVDDQIKVTYANNGFDARASYIADDNHKDPSGNTKKSRYAVSMGYTYQPMGLGAVIAYDESKYDIFSSADKDKDKDWGMGLHYTYQDLHLAGIYGHRDYKYTGTKNAEGTKYINLQAMYNWNDWTFIADYATEKGRKALDNSNDFRGVNRHFKEYTLVARYALTPKTAIYGEYLINAISGQDDLYGIGLMYNF